MAIKAIEIEDDEFNEEKIESTNDNESEISKNSDVKVNEY